MLTLSAYNPKVISLERDTTFDDEEQGRNPTVTVVAGEPVRISKVVKITTNIKVHSPLQSS